MGTWLNNDGLYIKLGTDEAKSPVQGGHVCSYGPLLTYSWYLDLTRLTETETIQNDVLVIPKSSIIESVEVFTVTAAATGTGIDVGLIANDRTTTTDLTATVTDADPDGLLAALVTADMVIGGYQRFWNVTSIPVADVAKGGALIGTGILTTPTLLTASRTTATAFTAGRVLVRVHVLPEPLVGFDLVH